MAVFFHLFDRRGVPIVYSWPSGHPGLLRGYSYDRESGLFTVFHLKQLLRALMAMDDVEKIHVVAHSRGTAVITDALREPIIELEAAGLNTREEMRLANLVLLAADLDVELMEQRLGRRRLRARILWVPAVAADLLLLLEGNEAGAEHGRPLTPLAPNVWKIGAWGRGASPAPSTRPA